MSDVLTAELSVAREPPRPNAPWLRRGHNCWRIEQATRLAFLIDGHAFFGAVRAALAQARHSFHVLGWDINSQMKLVPEGANDGLPEELGPFLDAIVARHRRMRGYVLAWDYAMLYALEREWWSFLRFKQRSLAFRLDDHHPVGASHHQKVIVVDDAVAFVSGFDLTGHRWDTSEHACRNPLRKNTLGISYGPFHDVGIMVEGPCAAALGELCRERWRRATGRPHAAPRLSARASAWPEEVKPDLTNVDVAISRTEPPFANRPGVFEVRRLHTDAIARARRFIFAENQYFTSSVIADALARRLSQPNPPDVALLMPASESGWLETSTMGVLRARMHARLRAADRAGRYRMYCPMHSCDENEAVCINVHSKVFIVDDELLTLGSANLANRSLCVDTECNLALEARGDARVRDAIAGLRARLLAEHMGVTPQEVLAQGPSLHAAIAALCDEHRRHLRPIDPTVDPALDAVLPDEVVDPDGPLDPHVLISDLMPARKHRDLVRARVVAVLAAAVLIGLLAMAWHYTGLSQYHLVDKLQAIAQQSRESIWAPFVMVGAFVVAGLTLIPLTLMIAITAAVFGPWLGVPVALAGALASGAVTFQIGRLLERRLIRRIAGRRLTELSRRLSRRGLIAVTLIRLLPIAPYTIVNIVAGSSRIRWRDFLIGTALGLSPGMILTSAFIDRAIAAIHEPNAMSVAALAIVLVAIVTTGWALHRRFGPASRRR
jgi:uncharacterized membrane protein YdjX (TVP38/TMEM64 family)/phosphatidylserine/phosphatidylglycerophosphate/cardiolipin synthase-like enzyme